MICKVCGKPIPDQRWWFNRETGDRYHVGCIQFDEKRQVWIVDVDMTKEG